MTPATFSVRVDANTITCTVCGEEHNTYQLASRHCDECAAPLTITARHVSALLTPRFQEVPA